MQNEGDRDRMGVSALQQIEHLTAALEARPKAVPRRADVMSLELGNIIRITNSSIDTIDRLGRAAIQARLGFEKILELDFHQEPVDDIAKARVWLKRFSKFISYPMMIKPQGHYFLTIVELLDDLKMSRVSDARQVRRLARRARESAEICEVRRKRLHKCTVRTITELDRVAEAGGQASEAAFVTALIADAGSRNPVINAYLGR